MITSAQLIKQYGDPRQDQYAWECKNMTMYDVPIELERFNPVIPKRIYCHRDFAPSLHTWLNALADASLIHEIKTWDGCFNVRNKRGASSLSLHAFGCAVDINASHNPLGLTASQCLARGLTPFSSMFIDLSRKYMDCGADWKTRPDGMHYQLKNLMP